MRLITLSVLCAALLVNACGSGSNNAPAATAGSGGGSGSSGAGAGSGSGSGSSGSSGGSTPQGKGVVISPSLAVAPRGGVVQFMAVVTGSSGPATIEWSVEEGDVGGKVAADGRYTAPDATGTFHVIAKSDSLSGTATVKVTEAQGTPPTLEPGVWKDITPPAPGFADTFGSTAIEVSPVDPNVIFVSIDTLGLWKTTDRGSNWVRLGEPGNPEPGSRKTKYLDSPVRVEVDPGDPEHVIATQGVRGAALGFWESFDGGENWEMPQGFFDMAKDGTADVTGMVIDPTDFKHVLLGSHSPWGNGKTPGVMETKDGGKTWLLHEGKTSWPLGSVGLSMLYDPASNQGDPNTWLVSMDGDGFWRTTDAGANWEKVSDRNTPHGGAQVYYAKDGTLYSGAAEYPLRSKDNGKTWEQIQGGLPFFYYYGVWGDGNTLYAQLSYTGDNAGQGLQPYFSSPESDGATWTQYQGGAQKFINGPALMRYDAANEIMYSANWKGGIWALKVLKP